jgi:ribosomal protein S18 acetylase RimI-like enzyme
VTVNIRPARVEDGVALLAIDFATWNTTVSPAPVPIPGERKSFFSEDHKPDDFLVAEVDGVVAGYVSLHQDIPLPSHAHVREINGLAVAPEAQGRGVGGELVEGAVTAAAKQGATKVTLRVLGPNNGAQRLYERCGFVVEGVLKGEFILDGQPVDDVLMARFL